MRQRTCRGINDILRSWKEYFEKILNPLQTGTHEETNHLKPDKEEDISLEESKLANENLERAAKLYEIRCETLKSLGNLGFR